MNNDSKIKAVNNKPKFSGKCYHCGMKGQKKVDCWKLKEKAATSFEDEILFSAMEWDVNTTTHTHFTFDNDVCHVSEKPPHVDTKGVKNPEIVGSPQFCDTEKLENIKERVEQNDSNDTLSGNHHSFYDLLTLINQKIDLLNQILNSEGNRVNACSSMVTRQDVNWSHSDCKILLAKSLLSSSIHC